MVEILDVSSRGVLVEVSSDAPIGGMRSWQLLNGELVSHFDRSTPWDPNEPKRSARCSLPADRFGAIAPRPHAPPILDCGCGLRASHGLGAAIPFRLGNGELVVGAVLAWGRVVIGPSHFRAERMEIVALATPADEWHERDEGASHIAALHQVPCVEVDELPAHLGGAAMALESAAVAAALVPPCGPLPIPHTGSEGFPAFRFRFDPVHGWVRPWGEWMEPWSYRPLTDTRQAVGEILAINGDHALSVFAWVPCDLRVWAEAALQDWARRDDWILEIAPGLHPLHDPPPLPKPRNGERCERCGEHGPSGYIYAMQHSNFRPSRCRCGGRRSSLAVCGAWDRRAIVLAG